MTTPSSNGMMTSHIHDCITFRCAHTFTSWHCITVTPGMISTMHVYYLTSPLVIDSNITLELVSRDVTCHKLALGIHVSQWRSHCPSVDYGIISIPEDPTVTCSMSMDYLDLIIIKLDVMSHCLKGSSSHTWVIMIRFPKTKRIFSLTIFQHRSD